MKRIIPAVLTLMFFTACEETVTLDLDQAEPVVIIEGLITDRNQFHYVRVIRSVDFYDHGNAEPITNADILVTDSQGNEFNFILTSNDSAGYYLSETPFAGVVGRSYHLEVTIGDELYTAEDELRAVVEIDSLSQQIDEDEFEDPDDEGYYYEMLFFAREPQETKDYYLFKFYRNDSIILDEENDIYISDDELIGESINGIPTAGYYSIGDVGTVEIYSISLDAYTYLRDLSSLINNDGGMFGPPPVNPRTNIQGNGALGFFQTSSVKQKSILIEDK